MPNPFPNWLQNPESFAVPMTGKGYTYNQLLNFYEKLLYNRLVEEKMLNQLRLGNISKWFSGIGQEAISVGIVEALAEKDYILPVHRNLGVFTGRNIPLNQLIAQFQGKKEGFTKGRDRSFHFGTNQHHIIGMISHLASQLPVACGVALGEKLSASNHISLAITGEGATSEGDFHEAMNLAATWKLPVIFLIENNGYSLSTPVYEQAATVDFAEKAKAYGMEGISIDGNNVIEVYESVKNSADKIRKNSAPILIEAKTFRMRGHEEASGTAYVPDELFTAWQAFDPITRLEDLLKTYKKWTSKAKESLHTRLKEEIDQEVEQANQFQADFEPSEKEELDDVYAPAIDMKSIHPSIKPGKSPLKYIEALNLTLHQLMEDYPELLIMGQDIAEYGGVFKATRDLVEKYGSERVRNTPLMESAILGSALGLSIKGYKSIIEMQFGDFVSCGFNQIVNNLAKSYYRWQQPVNTVIRLPVGAGLNAGPFHSQSPEAWFAHVPGLKLVYPSTINDLTGLLNASVADPNPVLFFEHKKLYRSVSGSIDDLRSMTPLGEASIVREGKTATIITYGMGVVQAQETADAENLDVEIIDLRTLIPWDKDTVKNSLAKTNRALVLHEGNLTGGYGNEIASWIGEHCFHLLDAPVMRLAAIDTPVPFNKNLEKNYLPYKHIMDTFKQLINF